MALDLGSKSLGLAISKSGIIANSYDTIYFKEDKYDEAINIMSEIIRKEAVDILVIGLPKHMNNDLGIRGEISIDFKNKILEKNQIEVILWDERSTTKAAIKTLIQSGASRKKQKQKKDELAAVIILQNYLDYKEKRE
ncbi:MAG TPA: Holliday junction resolvase RuvX [Acholeplasmataceae bacterium]|nr:Holliday junction resolvase RuvX [Acholeplasmataceae bacterium]